MYMCTTMYQQAYCTKCYTTFSSLQLFPVLWLQIFTGQAEDCLVLTCIPHHTREDPHYSHSMTSRGLLPLHVVQLWYIVYTFSAGMFLCSVCSHPACLSTYKICWIGTGLWLAHVHNQTDPDWWVMATVIGTAKLHIVWMPQKCLSDIVYSLCCGLLTHNCHIAMKWL